MDVSTQTDKSVFKKQKYKQNLSEQMEQSNVESNDVDNLTVREDKVRSCEFEIFGIVQNVSFRRYTLRRAQKLGVRGWCGNTNYNTVKGLIQAYPKEFETMRLWLRYTGSPTSRIDKCVFGPIEELDEFTYTEFSIQKM